MHLTCICAVERPRTDARAGAEWRHSSHATDGKYLVDPWHEMPVHPGGNGKLVRCALPPPFTLPLKGG